MEIDIENGNEIDSISIRKVRFCFVFSFYVSK